jgi:hypothetical protein
MTTPVKFTTKLGTARTVPLSRIWIEGKRLVDAGFTVGQYFVKEWHPEKPELRLALVDENDVLDTMPCKVSGKGATPIIDITGALVREVFGSRGTQVECTFEDGVITIKVADGR